MNLITVATGILLSSAALCSAQITNLLYNAPTTAGRDNYTGAVGCLFEVGSTNVVVSHLGYFSTNASTGLAVSHLVGLYTANRGTPTIISQVTVPAGTTAYYTSNYYWMPLNPPLLLSSNTQYIVVGMAGNNDGDGWHDDFDPTWDLVFVGTQATSTRDAIYGPGNTTWPPTSFGENGVNATYGAPNLANISAGPAYVGVQQTSVSISAGQTLTVNGFATGQLPITYQWYFVTNSVTNLLTSQTSATLVVPNAATTNSGTYFLFATNGLGGEASSNVVVTVSAIPVGIAQQPTNTSVFENYTATFSITASGTPPISYQWSSNGFVVSGATASTFSLVASLANNGDVYACMVSNNITSVPHTTNSSNAVLTVTYNLGLPRQFLHGYKANIDTNSFTGTVGGVFETGNSPALVTQLGYYASQYDSTGTNATLTSSHYVGIFSPDGTVLYGSALVPAGLNPVINGYMWAPLNPPLVLSTNTSYLLAAQVFSGTDPWGDAYTPSDWNPYCVGTNPPASQYVRYSGSAWPTAPIYTFSSGGEIYSAPNMSILALPSLSAYALPEGGVTLYAGFGTNLTAIVDGQAPLDVQWYMETGLLLTNQTNLTLNLPNLAVSNSGSYYVIAANPVTTAYAQSADVVVTVNADVAPYVVQDILPLNPTIVLGSSVTFSAVFNGSPTYTYGWQFNNNPVANSSRVTGANGNALTINDVQYSDAGSYQLLATNGAGSGQSSQSMLTVVPLLPFTNYGTGFSSQGNTINWPVSNILQLTSGIGNESNSAFSSGPLYIGAFEASFTYQVVNPLGTLADGVSFCLQTDPRGSAALGYGGGALGVSGASDTPGPGGVAIYPSVEFEMDVFTDGGVGAVAFGTNGAIGTYGPTTNASIPALSITNGDVISNFVTYDGTTLAVTMTDVSVGSANYGAAFATNQTINIPSVLGADVAYVGFTGADGGSRSTQQIGNFSFVSLPPLSAQASGGSLLLSWPDAVGGYMLMQSTGLTPPVWTPVAATPVYVNGSNQVTFPSPGSDMFYELVVTNVPNL